MGFRISLFGEFSIKNNEVEIGGLTSHQQLLIACLALHAHAPIRRSELAFKLWLDSNEEQALTNLRKVLHQLKQVFSDHEIIHSDTRTIQLHPDIPLDITDLTTALDTAQRARLVGDAEKEQTALETAAAVYKGDLLPGRFDEWLIPERERLQGMFIPAVDRLVALLETRKHNRDAIKYARRLLQADPLREDTYRTLIRLHALNNDRAAALNVYHICARTLAKELDVEPDPSTRQLYERLLKSNTQPLKTNIPVNPIPTTLMAREQELYSARAI